jgi:hypothetical protein
MKISIRFPLAALAALLMMGGCFESPDPGADVTVPVGDITQTPPKPGYRWSLPTVPPTRNSECTPANTESYGPSVPWTGFTFDGTTFTCNRCPGGDQLLQGKWRAIFDVDDPNAPYGPDPTFKETLEFDGNTFRNVLHGVDLGGTVTATIEGWFFCSSKPESVNETKFFVLTKVAPEGAFGWESGHVFTADTLMSDPHNMLLGWYDGVVTSAGSGWAGTAPYCRIGQEANGILCEDPF